MEIRIESPQFPLGASLNRYLRRRLDEELAFCRERVREVRAHLANTRSRYGGVDKQCRLVVHLHRGVEVVVQGVEDDLYMAIRRAADRLQQGVTRQLRWQAGPRLRRAGALSR